MTLMDLKTLGLICSFVLMTTRNEAIFKGLFEDLVNFVEENGFQLNSQSISHIWNWV